MSAPTRTLGSAAGDERVGRPAQVLGQVPGLQVDRPGEVDRDVAGADPVADVSRAVQLDRAEQPLREPDVGADAALVVAGEGAAGAVERGEQDGGPDEAEARRW